MESAKKILPFLAVAIIFAVGGYFVGHSSLSNQGASLYSAKDFITNKQRCVDVDGHTFPCDRGTVSADPSIAKPTGLGTTGPTGGDNGPAGITVFFPSGGCATSPSGQTGTWTPGTIGWDTFGNKWCVNIAVNPNNKALFNSVMPGFDFTKASNMTKTFSAIK